MIKLEKNIDMTQGVVWKQLIVYSIPLLLGEIFQQLYNTIDIVILGNYVNVDAMAAVAATDTVIKLLIGFFNGISVGSTVIVAFYFGKKDNRKLNQSIHTIIYFSFYVGLALSVIGLLITKPVLHLLRIPEELAPLSSTYIKIYFMGLLGLVLYNTVTGIFRALGDVRRPFYFLLLSSVLNIVLDLLFVIKFKWGVAGVAYATIIAQALSALLCLILLFKNTDGFSFSAKYSGINKSIIRRVLQVGLPIGLQRSIISFSNIIVLSYINFFGASCLAGWVVYNKLYQFITTGVQSIGSTVTVFVSQNEVAKKTERAHKGVVTAFMIAVIFTLCLSLIILVFNDEIILLFGDDTDMHLYAR
ncbi:MAG: MATE family efflux transporter [Clostridiales bacterium]|nr:MATE family efflux transporter [Clostridiales bacterium]